MMTRKDMTEAYALLRARDNLKGCIERYSTLSTVNIIMFARMVEDKLIPDQVADYLIPIIRGALIDHAEKMVMEHTRRLSALGVDVA